MSRIPVKCQMAVTVPVFTISNKLIRCCWHLKKANYIFSHGERRLSGRASDFGARGREFEAYLLCVVSLSMTLYSPKVLVIPSEQWLRPDTTEKSLTGVLNLNTNKQTNKQTNYVIPCTKPMHVAKTKQIKYDEN